MSRSFQHVVDSRFRKELERKIERGEELSPHERYWRFDDDLLSYEHVWVTIYDRLLADGYALRQRYNPDWKPKFYPMPEWAPESWGPRIVRNPREDGEGMLDPTIMDAVRNADQLRVVMKVVKIRNRKCRESEVMLIFSEDSERASDPRNHCVRLLEIKWYRQMRDSVLLVMPYLLPCNLVPFEDMGEILDFLHQVLEGVAYMHDLNVTHRDIATSNIMMYSPDLFPGGTHYLHPGLTTGNWFVRDAHHRPRHQVYCRYYLIDFGLSTAFKDFASRKPMRTGTGRYKHAPELLPSPSARCDGFALDVWCVGNLIREEFLEEYPCPLYLQQFAQSLMQDNPLERPTAATALTQLDHLRRAADPKELRRAFNRSRRSFGSIAWDVIYGFRSLTSSRKRIPVDGPPVVFPRTAEFRQE